MAQQDVLLPGIEHEEQSKGYLCGAAAVNMVLSQWDKQQPQADVWAAIQQNTGTQIRPPGAPSDDGSFPTQRCEPCSGGGFACWYTSPEALAATINAYSPEPVRADYHTSTDDALRKIANSLSAAAPVPAVFTTPANLHWVVAVGYQLDGPGPAVQWNGHAISALYVRDPALPDPGPDIMQLATVAALTRPLTLLLMAVECGNATGQYPVVVKGLPGGMPIDRHLSIYRVIATWLDAWKHWKLLREQRPGPPPR